MGITFGAWRAAIVELRRDMEANLSSRAQEIQHAWKHTTRIKCATRRAPASADSWRAPIVRVSGSGVEIQLGWLDFGSPERAERRFRRAQAIFDRIVAEGSARASLVRRR